MGTKTNAGIWVRKQFLELSPAPTWIWTCLNSIKNCPSYIVGKSGSKCGKIKTFRAGLCYIIYGTKKYCHILNFFFTPSAFTTLLSTFTKDYYMLHIRGAFKSQTTLCLPILKWNLLFYSFLVAGICCVTAGVIPSNQFEGRVLHDWFIRFLFWCTLQ